MRLALEVALARLGGPPFAPRRTRRRNDAAGQDPGHDRPGCGLHAGGTASARARRSSRRRTGRRRRPRSSRRSSRPAIRLAHNSSGANLVSGVASTLLSARDAELGLFEVDEGAFPDVARRIRPRAVCLGNLFRDQLDRYGELEQIAERWRAAVDALPGGVDARRQRRRPAGRRSRAGRARERHLRARRPARRPGRRSSTRPTRSTASAAARRTSTPPRTSGTSATTAARRAATPGHRCDLAARRSSCTGSRRPRSTSSRRRDHGGPDRASRSLQRLQRAGRRGAGPRAGRRPRRDRAPGSAAARPAFGRFERIDVGDRAPAAAPDQEPGRRERGRPHARRRRRPELAVIALNDAIADGRDVSWIWDVDFEPLFEASNGSCSPATAPPSSRCAACTAGCAGDGDRARPRPRGGLDRGPRARRPGRRADRPPHLHGDARAAADRRRARPRRRSTGSRRREDPRRAPLSRTT